MEDLDRIAADAIATEYGLGAVIWTNDLSTAHRLARKLKAGTVRVNGGRARSGAADWGLQAVGLGARNGREGFDAYTETKAIALQRHGAPSRQHHENTGARVHHIRY